MNITIVAALKIKEVDVLTLKGSVCGFSYHLALSLQITHN